MLFSVCAGHILYYMGQLHFQASELSYHTQINVLVAYHFSVVYCNGVGFFSPQQGILEEKKLT